MMKPATSIITILPIAFHVLATVSSKSILFMPAIAVPSHVKSMIPFAESLMKNGHNVSIAQYYAADKEKVTHDSIHFIYVLVADMLLLDKQQRKNVWRMKGMNPWTFLRSAWRVSSACLHSRYANDQADFYKNLSSLNWDLLVVDNVFQPCGIISSTHDEHQAWVDYSTTPMFEHTRQYRALALPPSVVLPWSAEEFQPRVFKNRLTSVLCLFLEQAVWFVFNSAMVIPWRTEGMLFNRASISNFHTNAVYSIGSLSSLLDIPLPQAANTFSLDYACPKAANLSQSYRSFVEDPSSVGTIVFSFGHLADWHGAPVEVIQAVSSAFESLSQYRFVWQFNGNFSMVSNRSHVRLEPWIPLPSLLQHPKTVLFITHSGIKSFREAICFAVPMLSIPLFGDQLRNTALTRFHGLGISLDKTKLTNETVRSAILEVLLNGRYRHRIEKLSAMLSDNLIDDREKGSFWIGFHLRHRNGVSHMRLKGTTMSAVSYHSYDVLALICVTLFVLHYGIRSDQGFRQETFS